MTSLEMSPSCCGWAPLITMLSPHEQRGANPPGCGRYRPNSAPCLPVGRFASRRHPRIDSDGPPTPHCGRSSSSDNEPGTRWVMPHKDVSAGLAVYAESANPPKQIRSGLFPPDVPVPSHTTRQRQSSRACASGRCGHVSSLSRCPPTGTIRCVGLSSWFDISD
jgi:hypothetical protein